MAIPSLNTKNHIITYSKAKPHTCIICKKGFMLAIGLKKHVCMKDSSKASVNTDDANGRAEVEINPYICEFCDNVFMHLKDYNEHNDLHSKKRYVCDMCDKEYLTLHTLKTHMLSHSVDIPQICRICRRVFQREEHLESHRQLPKSMCWEAYRQEDLIVNRESSGPSFVVAVRHNCQICGKEFGTFKQFQLHKRCHYDEEVFSCTVCDTLFNDAKKFTRHQKTHTTRKLVKKKTQSVSLVSDLTKYKSDRSKLHAYDKRLQIKASLLKHRTTHPTEEPFACRYCLARFSHEGALNMHVTVHIRGKAFSCNICGMKFYLSRYLRRHMRHHIGVTSYACDFCKVTFSLEALRQRHMTRCRQNAALKPEIKIENDESV